MRMDDYRESDNIEDRRGGGGGIGRGGVGIGGIVLALVVSYFTGINPMTLLGFIEQTPLARQEAPAAQRPPANDETAIFVSKVLASTEDVWTTAFQQNGRQYEKPKLVLFTGATPTACGTGQSAMGPFYCPGDQKVYIDLSFYRDLKTRFKAPGEFAQAYVIAHEVGHHIQNVTGVMRQFDQQSQRADARTRNALSIRLELQADCYAGFWAKKANDSRRWMDPGDLEAGLRAASAVGDDTIQRRTQGQVVPDAFTHGTAEQRDRWFTRGYESGDSDACDTFSSQTL